MIVIIVNEVIDTYLMHEVIEHLIIIVNYLMVLILVNNQLFNN